MKVVHLSHADIEGGAAKAAFRLHLALRKQGITSLMLVINKLSDDPNVIEIPSSYRLRIKIANLISKTILPIQSSQNEVLHSINLFDSGILDLLDNLAPDVVNLHWIGSEMLSIKEIAKFSCPVFWTFHDMWAFSGAEHYSIADQEEPRFIKNYSRISRSTSHRGLDLDRYTYNRKLKHWNRKSFNVICPSDWMKFCVKKSHLFSASKVRRIPNCVDHGIFKTASKKDCRERLSLPRDRKLLLFGAMSSTSDKRKGFSYLKESLDVISSNHALGDLELIVFGADEIHEKLPFQTHVVGTLKDERMLSDLYCAADAFVAPSLQDNLPNTVVESLACGTPCVAFDIGGMKDMIENKTNGVLVSEVSVVGLAKGIIECLSTDFSSDQISSKSELERSESVVAGQYIKYYQFALKRAV